MKRILLSVLLCVLVVGLLGCSQEAPVEKTAADQPAEEGSAYVAPTGQVYHVVIESNKFMPFDLEVKVGDTVEWVNNDYIEPQEYADDNDDHDPYRAGGESGIEHTVTFENGDFDVILPPGGTAQYIFKEEGLYHYFDQFHPGIIGSVSVSR